MLVKGYSQLLEVILRFLPHILHLINGEPALVEFLSFFESLCLSLLLSDRENYVFKELICLGYAYLDNLLFS